MSSNHSQWTAPSLHRYRPAILVLTALAAGCTIYYIHESFWSTAQSPISKGSSLHRSNACRSRRSQIRQRANTVLEQSPPLVDFLTSREENERVYGFYYLRGSNGINQQIHLRRGLWRDLSHALEASLSSQLTEEEVSRAIVEIPPVFLNFYFYRNLGQQDVDATSRESIILALQQDGFSRESVQDALDRLRDGQLLEQIFQWIQSQCGINNFPIETIVRDPEILGEWHRTNQGAVREVIVEETNTEPSWQGEDGEEARSKEGQNLLNLLFRIAEEQARREGYIHRGITCNCCSAYPIKGIRYRCMNCVDYDLCEACEALQIHPKTHLFYKVRIPRSHLGHQPQQLKYPGKYTKNPRSLPRLVLNRFCEQTNYRESEIEGFWEQFRCLAAVEWPNDPNHLHLAIDHRAFEQLFIPTGSTRPPPPNLIYDRVFSFYDTDNNNLIGFEEFIMGLSNLNKKGPKEKWTRIFRGFDIDGDGLVNRKDFLRMFKAHYSLTKEMTAEIIAGMEEESNEEDVRELVTGGRPLSSAFTYSVPAGQAPRTQEGKAPDSYGDQIVVDHKGALDEEDEDDGEENEDIIAQHADEKALGSTPLTNYKSNNVQKLIKRIYDNPWPPAAVEAEDVAEALHEAYDPSQVEDHKEQMEIRRACHSRLAQDYQHRHYVGWQAVRDRRSSRLFYPNERGYGLPSKRSSGDDPEHPNMPVGPLPSTAGYERLVSSNEKYEGFINAVNNLIADLQWPLPESRKHFRQSLQTMAYKGWSGTEMVENLKCYSLQTREIQDFVLKFLKLLDAFTPSPPSEDEMEEPAPPSRRSRSSSKVRFEDGLTTDDDGQDTRSVTSVSSRSIPVNERWGGYEIPEPEEDVGREVLYQVTQEALNEVIDPIFKMREDLWLLAQATRDRRQRYRAAICSAVDLSERVDEYLQRFLREIRIKQNYPPKKDSMGCYDAYILRDFIYSAEKRVLNQLTSELCSACRKSSILLVSNFCRCGAASTQYKQLREEEVFPGTERCVTCLERGKSTEVRLDHCCGQCGTPATPYRQEIERLMRIISGDGVDQKRSTSSYAAGVAELVNNFINAGDASNEVSESGVKAGDDGAGSHRLSSDGVHTGMTGSHMTNGVVGEHDATRDPNQQSEPSSPTSPVYPEAAIDLHNSVQAFDEANLSIEQKIAEKPLDELLDESGYEMTDETPSNNGQHSRSPSSSPSPPRSSSLPNLLESSSTLAPPDPTLPQNRPNSVDECAIPAPKAKSKGKGSSHSSSNTEREGAPDKATLLFWAALYLLEAEDEQRGGPGRLTEKEFLEIMLGERGKSMEFVGEWMNLMAF